MRLNGWHRLWIVFSGTLVLAAALVAVTTHSDASRPEDSDHYIALLQQNATKFQIKNPDGEQFKMALPKDGARALFEEFMRTSDAKTQQDFDEWADITMKRAAAPLAAQARMLNDKAREANAKVYKLLATIVLGLSLGTYLIGTAIAWVRAGFR